MSMPVRLRGHHFLCILTFKGYGYTPAFVANLHDVVARIGAGATIKLVEGKDDICNGFSAACRSLTDHDCEKASTLAMDRQAIEAVSTLLPDLNLEETRLGAKDIEALRERFREGSIRAACTNCSWKDFCTDIAQSGFAGTRL